MSKKALITGVTGQDGSYLAELLLEKGYEVHGMVRRSSTEKRERIEHLNGNEHFHLHYGDLADSMSIVRLVSTIRPMRFIIWRRRAMWVSALMCRNIRQM